MKANHDHMHIDIPVALPTALSDQTSVSLPGYDLWSTFIKNVYVVELELDCDAFVASVSRVLQLYPHAAGRLRQYQDTWSIELTNDTIPCQHVWLTQDEFLSVLPNRTPVVQDDLSGFLNPSPRGISLVNGDAPLLRFKLTSTETCTAIGVSWHHTLGDATVLHRFMHTISNFYQGLGTPYPSPSFTKPTFPAPTAEDVDIYLHQMPHLRTTYPNSELGVRYAEMNKGIVRVDFRVPGASLREIQRRANLRMAGKGVGVRLSRQDVLSAWVVMSLNRVLERPIETLTNAASYRHLQSPFIDANLAGNEIHIAKCPPWSMQDSSNLCSLALAIHDSIIESRKIEHLERWMSVASHTMLNAANTEHSMFFEATPGMMTVNSQLSLDRREVNFGSPESVHFYTMGVSDRYLRVYRSNPSDEQETGEMEDIDICFGVAEYLKERVEGILRHNLMNIDALFS